ncbi:MAG: FtsQ-type POTRA domain-containing protein [Firmicutes bacterium]|nr:FtsQ-type POTRA domain-containing protein [Bacillota bacterium]
MDKSLRRRRYSRRHARKPAATAAVKKYFLRLLLIFVLVCAVLGVLRSDLFDLKEVTVTGNERTPEAEIREALQVERGVNILQLDLDALTERVLAIPRIAHVDIRRLLPDGLQVEVTEYDTLVLVPYQEHFLEVGENGKILGSTADPQQYALPLLTGLLPVTGKMGENILDGRLLEQVRELCSALAETGVPVSEINTSQEENLIIVTMDGLSVWLGNKNFAEKAQVLLQILGQLGGRQGEGYLDLRVPTAPAFHIIETKNTKNN